MLQITIPKTKLFNEKTEEFVYLPEVTLKLEHSLLSVRRWESKWHKSYLSAKQFTVEEALDYIRCMSLDPNTTIDTIKRLTANNYREIEAYKNDPMSATTFRKVNGRPDSSILTCEKIYFMMVEYGIPFECEKWHLNQLLTLIRVCNNKGGIGGKKRSEKELFAEMQALNKSRRAKLGTKG